MEIIEVKNLSFKYPLSKNYALHGIDFSINKGSFCVLCGKSGSGKTTLLKLLKKELAPAGEMSGQISVKTEKIAFVSQNTESNIVTDTVFGELAFPCQTAGLGAAETAVKIAETAAYFNLEKELGKTCDELSGGTKQALSVACALEAGAELLILDEPCSQLDPLASENFINLISKINRENGTTVLMCTHNLSEVAGIADKAIFLKSGELAFEGSVNMLADFVAKKEKDMISLFPPYTPLFESHPLTLSQAKNEKVPLEISHIPEKAPEKPSIKAKSICFSYGKDENDVLFALDFAAQAGSINAVIGTNGSGKTTLLKCLGGILKPYLGKVSAKGKTAYMPQDLRTMFLYDTAGEEITVQSAKKFELENLLFQSPLDLSGGEMQRLALAIMFDTGADIFLLDEPTKNIDPSFKPRLASILADLAKSGKTVVFATHDLEFAGKYADFVSFLSRGSIAASGGRHEVFGTLKLYTTAISKLTDGKAVCDDEIKADYEKNRQ